MVRLFTVHNQAVRKQATNDNDEEKDEDSAPLFRQLLGHPLACYSGCKSKLRVLRSAAPHYPLMRKLLRLVYEGMRCNRIIKTIDSTLRTGDFETLCKLCGIEEFKPLFSVRRSEVTADMFQEPKLLNLESQLLIDHAMIAELEKKLADDPEFPCCSCERLHQRKQVTAFKFHEAKFSSNMWKTLKARILQQNPHARTQTHYVCQYCRPNLIQRDHQLSASTSPDESVTVVSFTSGH